MTTSHDYDVYFDEIGITDEEGRIVVLGFIRELFAIATDSLNNEVETVETWA